MVNNCPTRCNTKQFIYYSASSLYIFRMSTTSIMSTQNCNYSLRYWSYFLCSYLPPIWSVLETVVTVLCNPDDGCCWRPKHVEWTCRIINRLLCLSQYLTNLMHKICFTISFISCLYVFRAHVFIIRRSKLHYTASGIITPIGGRLVHETATYRCDDTRGSVIQFWPPDDEHMCSKHVEEWNKTYCEANFMHQVG